MQTQLMCFVYGMVVAAIFAVAIEKFFRTRKRSASHVCDEFTQWAACDNQATVMVHNGKPLPESERYEVSYHFQERRCTLCGKVFQEPLSYSSHFDEDDDADCV